jgi:hypothetical protein
MKPIYRIVTRRRNGVWTPERDKQQRILLWSSVRDAWAATPALFGDNVEAIRVEEHKP